MELEPIPTKSVTLTVRVTPEDARLLRTAASTRRVRLAEWLRGVAVEKARRELAQASS